MKPVEEKITDFVHSWQMPALLATLALLGSYVAYRVVDASLLPLPKGLGLPSPDEWVTSRSLSWFLAFCLNGAAGYMMVLINNRYNVLRDVTKLFAGLFLFLQLSVPTLLGSMGGSAVLAFGVILALAVLYAVYNKASYTRLVFLAFFIIATGALVEYSFLIYIPVFLLGLMQMRALTGRTVIAAILAIVTPAWICVAFGIVSLSDFRGPEFSSVTLSLSPERQVQFFASAAVSMLAGLVLCVINLVKVFSYNARARSYNGFVAVLLFTTCLAMVLDFTNIPCYITLLNLMMAFQATQYFVINIKRRGYIAILGFVVVYAALYCWWMVL